MSSDIKYALQFWKKFSKNVLLGLSFLMLLFAIIATQGNVLQRGVDFVTAQEAGEFEQIYDIYEEPMYEPLPYSSEPAPEVGDIVEIPQSDPGYYYQPEPQVGDITQYYEPPAYTEPYNPYSEPQVGNITEIYTEGPGCNGTHAVWGRWSGNTLVSVEADYGETGECGYSSSGSTTSGGYTSGGSSYSDSGYQSSYSSGSYEGPGCDGNRSVWGEWSSDGRLLRVEADYGAQAGECNNPVGGYSSGSTNYQSSGNWEFKYPECDWSTKTVYDVYQHTGTGEYDRRNPHYQEDACGYDQTWEGPGCQGNRSVWGIWSGPDRSRLVRVERDYGVVPGEFNNSVSSGTTQSQVRGTTSTGAYYYDERLECEGSEQVTVRYHAGGQRQVVSRYGRMPGYCGVGYTQPYTPTYNPAPYQGFGGYYAPYPVATGTYSAPSGVSVPVTTTTNNLVPLQISCSADTTMIQRGGSVTYYANSIIGGSGRIARYTFSGEGTQTSSSAYFVKAYPTSGVKYMRLTVYDADSRVSPQTVDCPVVSVYEPHQVQNIGTPPAFQGYGGYVAPYPVTAPPAYQGTGGYYAPYPASAPPAYQGTGGYYAPYPAAAPPPYQGTGGYYAPYPATAPAPFQGYGGYYAPYPAVVPAAYQGYGGYYAPYPSTPPPYQGTGGYYAPYADGTGAYYGTQNNPYGIQTNPYGTPTNPSEYVNRKVTISGNAYQPANISINAGEAVTWTNNDTVAHTVTSTDGTWGSQTLQPGQTFSMHFPNSGSFAYYCTLHPNMRGTVTVGSGGNVAPAINTSTKTTTIIYSDAGGNTSSPQVVNQTADASVTELPKTGLPLAAWAVAGLLPLGAKLRKGKSAGEFAAQERLIKDISANSIWMERELKKF